ncbi:hypothetical protein AtEden1_Chr1g0046841 [Arabidopsis thaliana]
MKMALCFCFSLSKIKIEENPHRPRVFQREKKKPAEVSCCRLGNISVRSCLDPWACILFSAARMTLSKSISLGDLILICILFVLVVAVIIFCLWRRKSPPSLPAQVSAYEVAMTPLDSRSPWSTPAQPDFSPAASSYYSVGIRTPSPYTGCFTPARINLT